MAKQCPKCGKINEDDWPLEINGEIVEGGCQDCWEIQCDKSWWEYISKEANGKEQTEAKNRQAATHGQA